MLWSPSEASDPPQAAAARAAIRANDEAEHRRLLYVAMTRAEDRLIVAGFEGSAARRPGNWYDMIASSLQQAGARNEPMPYGSGDRLVWQRSAGRPVAPQRKNNDADSAPLPDWLYRPAIHESALIPNVQASSLMSPVSEDDRANVRGEVEANAAMARGRAIHRLLQVLPGLDPAEREEAAARFLRAAAPELEADHEAISAQVIAILNDPVFAAAFADGSRAEVPLVGRIRHADRGEQTVSGRIDRLAVTDQDVLIVDFKTNRHSIFDLANVPQTYIQQLAIYRMLLQPLYPTHHIKAALVWTEGQIGRASCRERV